MTSETRFVYDAANAVDPLGDAEKAEREAGVPAMDGGQLAVRTGRRAPPSAARLDSREVRQCGQGTHETQF
jgi:hypothetical protein